MKLSSYLGCAIAIIGASGCGDNVPAPGIIDGNFPINIDASVDAQIALPDALRPDAMPARVTVHLNGPFGSAGPIVGGAFAFVAPDGTTTLSSGVTDANGIASAVVPAGSSVTIQAGPASVSSPPDLFTFLDVKPGDDLVIGNPNGLGDTNTVNITIPTSGAASSYQIASACGSTTGAGPTIAAAFSTACTTTDLIVSALDMSGDPIGQLYAPNISLTNGSSLSLSETYSDPTSVTFAATNLAGFVEAYDMTAGVADGTTVVGAAYYDAGQQFTNTPPAANSSILNVPAFSGPTFVWGVDVGAIEGESVIVLGREANPGDETLDFSTITIPTIDGDIASYEGVVANAISWTEDGTGSVDAARVDIAVSLAAAGFNWHIVGPHAAASLAVPTLPNSLAIGDLSAASGVSITSIALYQVPHGWDVLRANIFAMLGDQFDDAAALTTTIGDRAVISYNAGSRCVGPQNPRAAKHAHRGRIHPC